MENHEQAEWTKHMNAANGDDEKLRQAFLAVVETGSFAAAARQLGRDASVLSRRVSALEHRLGIRLLERSTRRLSPTEAGSRYYTKVRQGLQLIREAGEEAQNLAAAPSGLLRLSIPAAFGRRWITPALPEFLQAFPAVQLELGYSDRYVDLIGEEFDVAVRIGSMKDSQLLLRKLAPTRRVLCAAPSYLRQASAIHVPQDLRRADCLMFTSMSTHPVWHFETARRTQAVRVQGRLASDDIESLIAAACAGHGVLMAADWLVYRELADGRLVELLPQWQVTGEHGVFLLRPSRQHEAAKVRAFSDWLMARFRNAPWLPA